MLKEARKNILRKILTAKARERLARVKLVKPLLATQIENYLIQLYQEGKIKNLITESQIKQILLALSPKREFKIRRIKK